MVKIFAKVAILMGVTWLLAIVPSLSRIQELWYLFIIINGLQGVYIFWSFGIKHIKQLRKPLETQTSLELRQTYGHSTPTVPDGGI